jgi:adenosylcobinamide-GDP ribazoletransferase
MRRALAFLTPFGGAQDPSPAALTWFPLVGALLGAALGVIWKVSDRLWYQGISASLVLVADLAFTGLLHADGLIDSADGLLPPLASPERRLAVMADPTAGAFGVATMGVVLLLRWTALISIQPSVALLAGLWCMSRTTMAVVIRTEPYARGAGGLASGFQGGGGSPLPLLVGGTTLALLLGALTGDVLGLFAVAAVSAGGWAVVALARRRIGGYTGDVLGAAGMVGETLGLLVAAVRR